MNRRETVSDPRVGRVKTIPHRLRFAIKLPSASGLAKTLNAPPVPDA
jgi:hypothetical protein